jgi:hypothetical protein
MQPHHTDKMANNDPECLFAGFPAFFARLGRDERIMERITSIVICERKWPLLLPTAVAVPALQIQYSLCMRAKKGGARRRGAASVV